MEAEAVAELGDAGEGFGAGAVAAVGEVKSEFQGCASGGGIFGLNFSTMGGGVRGLYGGLLGWDFFGAARWTGLG